jgi:nucleotide-binding universal stress UspA family protein
VLRCLEVKASRRYQSAAQLAIDLRNPDQVALGERAAKTAQDSFFTVLRRKSEPAAALIDRPEEGAGLAEAPIVAIALNLDDLSADVSAAIRATATRLIERAPQTRIACLNVLKLARLTLDTSLDEEGRNKHVERLVELKDWAHELKLPAERLTFHVLEAVDPAEAILEYAGVNNVDHLIMGARANSTMRKLLGSVSGKVAAEAPCTVTVVRCRQD